MRILLVEALAALSLWELTDVVLDHQNTPEIRQAALERWKALSAQQRGSAYHGTRRLEAPGSRTDDETGDQP